MKTAIYVRVSTLEQAEGGYSISEQTDRLKKYCEAKEWTVVNIYTDPGFTGSNTDRPALSRLINDVKDSQVEMVLVYKLDRLSRSQKDTLYLIEDVFLKNGVDFVSMSENFDTTTPLGRAMIGILSVFAQLEREQIKERMAMGHIGRAKNGYWHGGSGAMIGYNFIDNELVIDKYEAMQVRECFALYLSGNSFNNICRIMREKKYTNRYGCWKNAATVASIITNTTYIGKIRYKGEEFEGHHDTIIDPEIFAAANRKYAADKPNFVKHGARFFGTHFLSGLMFCGNCGARYFTIACTSKKYGSYQYYKCYSRDGNSNMKKMDHCKNPTYKKEVLDDLVKNEIRKLAFDPGRIDELNKIHTPKSDDRVVIIENRISQIDKQINKLMDLYQLGTIDISEIGKRIEPLKAEKDGLFDDLAILDINVPVLSVNEAKDIVRVAEEVFACGDENAMRLFARELISKVIIFADHIEIHWKFTT